MLLNNDNCIISKKIKYNLSSWLLYMQLTRKIQRSILNKYSVLRLTDEICHWWFSKVEYEFPMRTDPHFLWKLKCLFFFSSRKSWITYRYLPQWHKTQKSTRKIWLFLTHFICPFLIPSKHQAITKIMEEASK